MEVPPNVKETHLKEGDAAPDFTLPDQNKRIHRLPDYQGQRVLLYFYGQDDTPG